MAKRILLADDSITIQKVISITFASEGYELIMAGDGDTAIQKAREAVPDLILADVAMPGMNGYEVCDAVKKDPALSHVPVILLAGTFEPLDKDEAIRVGADDSIIKPFESQELIEKVRELLDISSPPSAATEEPQRLQVSSEGWEAGDFSGFAGEFEEKGEVYGKADGYELPDLSFSTDGLPFDLGGERAEGPAGADTKKTEPFDIKAAPFVVEDFDVEQFKPGKGDSFELETFSSPKEKDEPLPSEPQFELETFDQGWKGPRTDEAGKSDWSFDGVETSPVADLKEEAALEPEKDWSSALEPIQIEETAKADTKEALDLPWADLGEASAEVTAEGPAATQDVIEIQSSDLTEIPEERPFEDFKVFETKPISEILEGPFEAVHSARTSEEASKASETQVSGGLARDSAERALEEARDDFNRSVEESSARAEARLAQFLAQSLKEAESKTARTIEEAAARIEARFIEDIASRLKTADERTLESVTKAAKAAEERLVTELAERLEKRLSVPAERIEEIVRRSAFEVIERVAREAVPAIAERVIRAEFERIREAISKYR